MVKRVNRMRTFEKKVVVSAFGDWDLLDLKIPGLDATDEHDAGGTKR